MTELKPCPFCGGEVVLLPDDSYGHCGIGCHCEAEPFVQKPVGQEAEAIAAWNTRAAPRATGGDGELEHAAKVVADEIAHLRFGARKTDTPERQARRLRRFEAALESMGQAAARITALSAEVERLTKRLEAEPPFDRDDLDGIACRDETIKLLEARLAALGAKP